MISQNSFVTAALAAALVLGASNAALAAGYLKIGDIKGEARDARHKNWIEIESWSWGQTAGASTQSAPSGGPGTLTIVKTTDKSTPKLQEACVSGKMFKDVELDLPSGGRAMTYTTYTMSDVRLSCAPAAPGVPTEQISFNFTKIEWDYRPGRETPKPRVQGYQSGN